MDKSIIVENIPEELRAVKQWVCWKYEARTGKHVGFKKQKPAKLPVDCKTGRRANVTDSKCYYWFAEALAYAQAHKEIVAGVGFVFTSGDPYTGIDIDKCRNLQTGFIDEWAAQVIALLASYTEVSPSGTGVKIFVKGRLPDGSQKRKGNIEIYTDKRYFTVTGLKLPDCPSIVEERQQQLLEVYRSVFEIEQPNQESATSRNDRQSCQDFEAMNDADAAIIGRAMAARNGDKFEKLWKGDISGYTSQSEADLALCQFLVYWANGSTETVERLFAYSEFGKRDKWLNRPDYRAVTIWRACKSSRKYSGDGLPTRTIRATRNNQSNQEQTQSNQEQLEVNTGLLLAGEESLLPLSQEDERRSVEIASGFASDCLELLIIDPSEILDPDEVRERNWKRSFELARKLQTITRDGADRFTKAVETFCTTTEIVFDDFWWEFLEAWDRVEIPEGQGILDVAVQYGFEKTAKLPNNPMKRQTTLAVIAWFLSVESDDGRFWLPRKQLGKLLGVDQKTITNIVARLIKHGFLVCENDDFSYENRTSKEYRFIGPTAGTCLTMSEDAVGISS